jgi:hypothetical protein
MELFHCPSPDIWFKFFSCYYWSDSNGFHPKFNDVVTIKDIDDKKWIPYDHSFETLEHYFRFQDKLKDEEKQFGVPPFKMTIPLGQYGSDPSFNHEKYGNLFNVLSKIEYKKCIDESNEKRKNYEKEEDLDKLYPQNPREDIHRWMWMATGRRVSILVIMDEELRKIVGDKKPEYIAYIKQEYFWHIKDMYPLFRNENYEYNAFPEYFSEEYNKKVSKDYFKKRQEEKEGGY